ncbi:MAG: Ulp1 family isopeptidase [Candidatus Cardinium sp.]|nr:MAG: Ulp1 family isopeptidase [Candidatus Cardinium sp.]
MKMIENRSKKDDKLPKVYIFDSLFYSALKSCPKDKYDTMQCWIKGDLFSCDMIIIPIHLENHWCLAVINLPENPEAFNVIEYYDSLGEKNEDCEKKLLSYFSHVIRDKNWIFESKYQKGASIQHDGSACGVFICQFADYAARGAKIDFKQEDIPLLP